MGRRLCANYRKGVIAMALASYDYGLAEIQGDFFFVFGECVPSPEAFVAWMEGLSEEQRGHLVVMYHAAPQQFGDTLLCKMSEWYHVLA